MELLAPARDLNNLKAAFDAGADAVYLGLKNFSARKRAKNFSREELYTGLNYAKSCGKKIFVALNTLIYEEEIKELIETLYFLEEIAVDGIIIQDYGIYKIVKDFGINLALIASTQMATTNSVKAKFLQDLGFKRIILERQLTIKDIEKIRNSVSIEIEVFIHGAMCFSLSGLCHFSSQITGKSGNRGECVQPCRWAFERESKENKFFFSMKDLNGLEYLKTLKKMGINSIKIEGRLKGIDYTYSVVSAYRSIIDGLNKKQLNDLQLKEVMDKLKNIEQSRELSDGFFEGQFSSNRLIDQSPSAGLYIGKISGVFERSVFFKTRAPLSVGDMIRVVDNSGKERYKIPIKALYKKEGRAKNAVTGDYIGIPYSGKKLSAGDRIYLINRRDGVKIKSLKPIPMPPVMSYLERAEKGWNSYLALYKSNDGKPEEKVLRFQPRNITYQIDGKSFYFIPPHIFDSKDYEYFSNKKNLIISHPAEARLFKDANLYGSFYLYCTNSMSALFYKSLGIKAISFSPDVGIAKSFLNLFPLILKWQNIPLFVTRVKIGEGQYFLRQRDLKIDFSIPYGIRKL